VTVSNQPRFTMTKPNNVVQLADYRKKPERRPSPILQKLWADMEAALAGLEQDLAGK
jgi:hypothetical protein